MHMLGAIFQVFLRMHAVLRYVDWTSASLAVLAALLTLFLLEIFRFNSIRNKFPPGPQPLPLIGNLQQMAKNPMGNIREVHKYGDMTTLFLGRRPHVVINNLQLVKEVFIQSGAVTSGRPEMPLLKWITKSNGIVMANGNEWKEQRRFALHTFRDFGLGRKMVEERVVEEAGFLVKEMLKQEGKPFYPIHLLMNAISNIICFIVFGDRFDYDNQRFAKLLQYINENIQLVGSPAGQFFNLLPILRFFPGPHQKIRENSDALHDFIYEALEEHRKTLDPENPRDFIDAYLVEMSKHEPDEDSSFHENNVVMSTIDLFFAGTDTSANTLRWGIIFLMENPQVQECCHEEIVSILGYDRTPTMDDRAKLPYTYATIHEVQRCANLIPLGFVHETTEPLQLQGYHFPKGTQIMPNLTAIMTDKNHWKHPDTFNPENFLGEKGQFCKQESFLPFSLGPRVCLGESLARMELFIFFTCLLQHLHFSWPPGAPPPNMEGIVGVVRSPLPFNTICRSRVALHLGHVPET